MTWEDAISDTAALLVDDLFTTVDRADRQDDDFDREANDRAADMLVKMWDRGTTDTVVLLLASCVTALVRSQANSVELLAQVVDKLVAEKAA